MKTLHAFLLILQAVIIPAAWAQGPGSAGVLFLLIQPSPRANGMGGTSVAYTGNDAFAVAFNPAQLGRMSLDYSFVAEVYPGSSQWLPQLASGLGYDSKTVLLGYPFQHYNQNKTLSFGLAYTRVSLDLGEIAITDESGPEVIGTFHATERANVWSAGVGFDDLVQGGVGFSFKDIQSSLAAALFRACA